MKIEKSFELSYFENGSFDFVAEFTTVSKAVNCAKEIFKNNKDLKGSYSVFNSEIEIVATIYRYSFNNEIEVNKY